MPCSRKNSRKTLHLHIFVEGSGERVLHHYLHGNAAQLNGLVYPFTQYDLSSLSPYHAYVANLMQSSLTAPTENARNYYTQLLIPFWQRIAACFKKKNHILLSLGEFPLSWEAFWKTGCSVLDFSDIQIQPLLTLPPQEDYQETRYRYHVWRQSNPATLQPGPILCNYAELLKEFQQQARLHGAAPEAPRIFWKAGSDDDAEGTLAVQVLAACGIEASRQMLPPDHLSLYAYDTRRFASLVFPQPFASGLPGLGTLPRFTGSVWPALQTRGCLAALQKGEQQGLFSLLPFSSSAMRQKARMLGTEGNQLLAHQFPELAKSMDAPARYPADMPGIEPHTLNREQIDCCLQLLSAEQREWVRYCLNTEFIELTEEQQEIKGRLQPEAHITVSVRAPEISVLTLAYNQKEYIARTIESVLKQQCSYHIQHIIVDDGSDDGTQDIIEEYARRYPQKIVPFFLHRIYKPAASNVKTLFGHCHTQYAALCDGDDYFTDPHKLQKQVDFLEQHPECALCFHPVDVVYADQSPSRIYPPEEILPGGIRDIYTLDDLLTRNFIQTNSVVYRWRFKAGLPEWFDCEMVPGDWYWHILHAETGKIAYLKDHMSVYWRHTTSFYASAEGNHIEHRKVHGMQELRVYDRLNRHFHHRYYPALSRLAMGVLSDFMQIYLATGDNSLLEQASAQFPGFTRSFLSRIKRELRLQKASQVPPDNK